MHHEEVLLILLFNFHVFDLSLDLVLESLLIVLQIGLHLVLVGLVLGDSELLLILLLPLTIKLFLEVLHITLLLSHYVTSSLLCLVDLLPSLLFFLL